jgi:branched-subunit amino acid transport protein AzlD
MHPSDENHMKDDLESDGTYRVAPDEVKRDAQEMRRAREGKPARAATTRALETRQAHTQDDEAEGDEHEGDESEESDESHGESHDENHDENHDDSLPPPISRPANPKPWLVIAGITTAFLMIAWLAGAPQLVVPEPSSDGSPIIPELGFFERLAGVARTAVYLALATLGGVFGVLCLAFLRQRPVGDFISLFAKVLAIVAIGMLVWLVPSEIRFVKQTLNVLGMPLLAGLCAMPVLRLAPRDAALATAFTMMGMLLLVLVAHTVVWAAG